MFFGLGLFCKTAGNILIVTVITQSRFMSLGGAGCEGSGRSMHVKGRQFNIRQVSPACLKRGTPSMLIGSRYAKLCMFTFCNYMILHNYISSSKKSSRLKSGVNSLLKEIIFYWMFGLGNEL